MKLTFLGSGSAFTVGDNYHSNMLLTAANGKKLLIDCGSDVRHALYEQGFSYLDIQDVYVSHLHADHIGGLEWLAFTTKFDTNCPKPRLHISKLLLDDLWNKSLKGGLSSISDEKISIDTYFDVNAIGEEGFFLWNGIQFELHQTVHIISGNELQPSFGLYFKFEDKIFFITTDAKFSPDSFVEFYENADLIFQDCETAQYKSGVHAHYTELITLPLFYKAKMWLYHYQPNFLPDSTADGFRGFVKKGQVFNLSDPKIM